MILHMSESCGYLNLVARIFIGFAGTMYFEPVLSFLISSQNQTIDNIYPPPAISCME